MSDVDVKDKIKVRKKKSINSKVPKTYFVILLNDDYRQLNKEQAIRLETNLV
mgnify:CR=1 FL=1